MVCRSFAVVALVFALCIPCLGAETVSARGVVVDPEGNPVSGVKVYAVMRGPAWDAISVKGAAVSGAEGRFELASLPKPKIEQGYDLIALKAGEYLGWAEGQGKLFKRFRRDLQPDGDYRITVSKPDVYEGRVVDTAGNPIAGVEVVPYSLFARPGGRGSGGPVPSAVGVDMLKCLTTIPSVTTDSEGAFRLEWVPAHADPSVSLSKPGYSMGWGSVEDVDPRRMVLLPAGSIAGAVVDQRGRGVAGVNVDARAARGGRGGGSAKTTADGSYVIEGLLPGSYYVKLWDAKDVVAKPIGDILVKAGETTRIPKMVATPGAVLQIRTVDVDTGEPIAGLNVSAHAPVSELPGAYGTADDRGSCALRLLGGEYQVSITSGAASVKYQPKNVGGVKLPATGLKSLVVKLRKAEIARGKVVDSSGAPLAGASVSIGSPWDSKTTTVASGLFTAIVPPAQKSSPG